MKIDIHTHNIPKDLESIFVLNHSKNVNTKYTSLSYHPWDVKEKSVNDFLDLVRKKSFLILGEIGLDKVHQKTFEKQNQDLSLILEFCNNEKIKNIIFHCVRSFNEIQSHLDKLTYSPTIIFHDYSGSLETAGQFIKKTPQCYFSFGASLFNEKRKSTKAFLEIPPQNIFLETDDQVQYSIEDIYSQGAKLKKMSLNELEVIIWDNFQNLF